MKHSTTTAVRLRYTPILPPMEGWTLLGAYPDQEPNDIGSWLLHHHGEALLLEVPPGLTVTEVEDALEERQLSLKYVGVSHAHEDHFYGGTWRALRSEFLGAQFISSASISRTYFTRDRLLYLSGEPLWLIKAPKHSLSDIVTVFRGVAMTGDIELGTLDSVNDEVPEEVKRRSMKWLQGFQERQNYHVHTVISAHLNDIRTSVDWPSLFEV